MPYCKKCHSRIDRFDKDRCPICGEVNPFDGVSSDTTEITTSIDSSNLKDIDYHPRKRIILLLLYIFLGLIGVPFFYLYKRKIGIVYGLVNLAVVGGLFSIFYLVVELSLAVALLLAFLLIYIFNSMHGVYLYYKPSIKDGRGEFLI